MSFPRPRSRLASRDAFLGPALDGAPRVCTACLRPRLERGPARGRLLSRHYEGSPGGRQARMPPESGLSPKGRDPTEPCASKSAPRQGRAAQGNVAADRIAFEKGREGPRDDSVRRVQGGKAGGYEPMSPIGARQAFLRDSAARPATFGLGVMVHGAVLAALRFALGYKALAGALPMRPSCRSRPELRRAEPPGCRAATGNRGDSVTCAALRKRALSCGGSTRQAAFERTEAARQLQTFVVVSASEMELAPYCSRTIRRQPKVRQIYCPPCCTLFT